MKYRFSVAAASLLVFGAVLAPTAAVAQNELNRGSDWDTPADGRGNRAHHVPPRAANGGAVVTGNGIGWHGGPVLHNTVNVYYIWYGTWTATQKLILTDFASNIGGSPYMGVNTTYGDTFGNVSGAVALAGQVSVAATKTTLSDTDIQNIVAAATSTGGLPADTNGVFFVLTAPGIGESSGFLTQYCGWHTAGTINGADIKYSFVGNATGPNLGSCAMQTSSPNGDAGVDAMISVICHELERDPQYSDLETGSIRYLPATRMPTNALGLSGPLIRRPAAGRPT